MNAVRPGNNTTSNTFTVYGCNEENESNDNGRVVIELLEMTAYTNGPVPLIIDNPLDTL